MKYRPEIDGLRAIAVIPVILFHAGISVFSGGYVGVDVFFVISGYLITTILLTELEAGDFSLLRFYERRARRILPALSVVLVFATVWAWVWMSPDLFRNFCQSVIAVVFFGSNILFWREAGYFDVAAELKPLLHTWSLAVEEQYYILFPLFLMLLPRFGRRALFWGIVVLALASLLLSEQLSQSAPTANFYLLPTRAWELLAGSICAFLTVGRSVRPNNLLGLAGLGLILGPIFYYDSTTPFPGLYALAPVGGTVLIVLFAQGGTWTARLLSTPALVGIGLVSYSAYLWHQPLFAFARLQSPREPSHMLMIALALLTLGLAYLSWRFVERPFRRRPTPVLSSQKSVFLASAAAGGGFVVLAVALLQAPTRLELSHPELFATSPITPSAYADCPGFDQVVVSTAGCRIYGTGEKTAVIWGDSHGAAIMAGIEPVPDYSVMVLYQFGCPPAAGLRRPQRSRSAENCASSETLSTYAEYIKAQNPTDVFLIGRWGLYQKGSAAHGDAQRDLHFVTLGAETDGDVNGTTSANALTQALRRTIANLSTQAGVHMLLQPPDLHFMGPHQRLISQSVALSEIADWHQFEEELATRLAAETDVQVLSSRASFCSEETCILRQDGFSLYNDDNHLSPLGARIQWRLIAQALEGSG